MRRHKWAEFLPFSIPKRTPYSDGAYAVLGRAITYIGEFESQCAALSDFIGIDNDKNRSLNERFREKFLKFVHDNDLGDHLEQMTEDLEDGRDLKKTFKKAQDSKRRIIKEIPVDKKQDLDKRESRKQFIDEVEESVRDIATADAIINSISILLTKETAFFPKKEYINEYPEKIVKWVVNQ